MKTFTSTFSTEKIDFEVIKFLYIWYMIDMGLYNNHCLRIDMAIIYHLNRKILSILKELSKGDQYSAISKMQKLIVSHHLIH